jgi:hypothetical protein
MAQPDSDLRRTWLFGPHADPRLHADLQQCGADPLKRETGAAARQQLEQVGDHADFR